jgi:hypothetical protein
LLEFNLKHNPGPIPLAHTRRRQTATHSEPENIMRLSIVLPMIALLARLVYGFSSQAAATSSRFTRSIGIAATPSVVVRRMLPSSERFDLLIRGGGSKVSSSSTTVLKQTTSSTGGTPYKTDSKCPVTGAAAVL